MDEYMPMWFGSIGRRKGEKSYLVGSVSISPLLGHGVFGDRLGNVSTGVSTGVVSMSLLSGSMLEKTQDRVISGLLDELLGVDVLAKRHFEDLLVDVIVVLCVCCGVAVERKGDSCGFSKSDASGSKPEGWIWAEEGDYI